MEMRHQPEEVATLPRQASLFNRINVAAMGLFLLQLILVVAIGCAICFASVWVIEGRGAAMIHTLRRDLAVIENAPPRQLQQKQPVPTTDVEAT
jgi:hypothetical protein